MKIQSRNLVLFVVPFILLLILGCDYGKLSNSMVEKILKEEYPRYITSTVQISDHSLSPYVSNELKLLSAKGLATYNYIPPGTSGYGCYGKLTESGSQFFVSKIDWDYIVMAVAKVDFDRVLGIREIPEINSSVVEYTEKITQLTPVGEIYNDMNVGKTYNVTATFIKYNDGWRIEEISTNAKKIVISEPIQQSSNEGTVVASGSGKLGVQTKSEIEVENKASYRDIEEFYKALKTAVLSKDMNEVSKFLKFPFFCDYGEISKKEFLSDKFTLGIKYFDIFTRNEPLFKFGDGNYGLIGPPQGPDLSIAKDNEGYWKLNDYLLNEVRGD